MTDHTDQPQDQQPQPALSLSWQDMALVRIRPSDLARLLGVSRQTVSQWIAKGIVTQFPDGRLDPVRATREVIERGNPGTIRVRVLREAMAEARREFDKALAAKDAELAKVRTALAAAEGNAEEWFERIDLFERLLRRNAGTLRASATDAEFSDLLADFWFDTDSVQHRPGRFASTGGREVGESHHHEETTNDTPSPDTTR